MTQNNNPPNNSPSIKLNTTFTHEIQNYTFDSLSEEICIKQWKDGRPFSHFSERWLVLKYPLIYVEGSKKHDFLDKEHPEIRYEAKTFTQQGCKFCPSNMIGQGRTFDQRVFKEKSKKLIFCIVSNVNFPEIKVRFVRGSDLIKKYPKGQILPTQFVEFFD